MQRELQQQQWRREREWKLVGHGMDSWRSLVDFFLHRKKIELLLGYDKEVI